MLNTTILFTIIMIIHWRWTPFIALPLGLLFFIIEAGFFTSALLKVYFLYLQPILLII